MDTFLYQATVYLATAVLAVPIAARLGLGSVLGYLAAGIIVGPVLGLVGSETQDIQHVAEFGVVMMLFLIGLELDPRTLWNMRSKLMGLGGPQVVLTALALMGVAIAFGQGWAPALAIGLTLALSSTAIVLQTLSEKGLTQTQGGRSVFSVLLTQDVAVIPILAFMPLLAAPAVHQGPAQRARVSETGNVEVTGHEAAHHGPDLSLVEGLPGWGVTLVTLGAVVAVILAGIYLVRPLFHYIYVSRLREMHTALALLIVVGIAFLMTLVGLSPALGTFLAGVVLANSEFKHEMESDLEPFKGLLLGLFFITVGAGIQFGVLFGDPLRILGMTLLLIVAKGAILYVLGRAFGLRGRHLWLFTLSLAQAGEFGFVLLSFSLQQQVVTAAVAETLLLVVALSMLITPALFILYDQLSRRMADTKTPVEPDPIDIEGPVIIAGIGRFGQIVNRLVQASGIQTVVLDHDMETIQLMRRFGFKGFLGDPTRPELLKAAGLDKAKILVAAMDDAKKVTQLVAYARKERPDLHIIARAYDRNQVYELYRAGANDIVREMFDSSLRAGRYVLENAGLTEFEAAAAEQTFYAHDRQTVRELAELWDPAVPTTQNAAYIARARELQKDLETALMTRASETDKKSA
ncbi:cation:proton antiporter domain-containing protein [Marinibacterium profundimaris]|uniref:Potassium transporter n=1 Tax=Marinibacterium profundimaris TaxID=1679460 RepID=A0A225NDB3_9RHOB|nr:cation:proton antiporter [Marinibacterium profundimaris]OWU69858.1 potassium transporter [Marinibacterium profundimaris]